MLNISTLWFFSGGIALALTGTLNLLHRVYGRIAPGLRRVCIGTNIFMTIFGVLLGVVSHASLVGFTLVLGLIGGATVLSLSRRALIQPAEFCVRAGEPAAVRAREPAASEIGAYVACVTALMFPIVDVGSSVDYLFDGRE